MQQSLIIMNTGNMPIILGFALAIFSLAGLVVILFMIKNKSVSDEALAKVTDLWKWTVGTLLVSITISVVSDAFKERDYDKGEMQVFNQYMSVVIDTGGIEKKWQLCQFFKAVSPEGNMRDAWERWATYLETERKELEKLNNQEQKAIALITDAEQMPSEQEIKKLNEIHSQTEQILKDLNVVEINEEYLVIISADKTYELTETERTKAAKSFASNVAVYKKGNMFRVVLPGSKSFGEAKKLLQKAKKEFPQAYVVKLSNWCDAPQPNEENDKYWICN